MYDAKNSIYCYDGTNILINKLNIRDYKSLEKCETSIVSVKLLAMAKMGITGNFDNSHFVSIHRFLFEDLYPFAGSFRTENISKGYFQFAQWEYIETELTKLLNQLKSDNYLSDLSKKDFANKLAYYWSELNVLHPFREGNGRTTREFLRQLSLKNSYILNLENVSSKLLLDASKKSVIDISDLSNCLNNCLDSKLD